MATGVCCHWLEEKVHPRSGKKEWVNIFDEKTLQLGRYRQGKYPRETIENLYLHNVKRLAEMLPKIHRAGVKVFRISSAMFPLADQVDRQLWDNVKIKNYLKDAGEFVKNTGMRVSTHPGQFCVLSSDSDSIVAKSFEELAIHAWLFDSMGLDVSPQYAINIHGGKSDRITRLVDQINSLPDNIRKRLTLENDETAYNVIDLLDVHLKTGVPIVWDSHHHTFNDGDLSLEDAFMATAETWPKGIKPLQHISNTDPKNVDGNFMDRRKHSDMIHYIVDPQLNALRDDTIDLEVEAKLKNIAVFEMRKNFNIIT
jgi:UV DNA damage endonuclease